MMLLKCCAQYASKFEKLSSGPRTGKGQFSFQSQRKAMPKNVQTGFRKGRGIRDQIANNCRIIGKAREFQKNICFIDYSKAFDCVDHNKLWKILKEMGIPAHLSWLLINLHAGQKATLAMEALKNGLFPNWERSTSRLYIVTLLI